MLSHVVVGRLADFRLFDRFIWSRMRPIRDTYGNVVAERLLL